MVADSGSGLPPDAHSVCTEVRVAPSKHPRDDKVMDSTKTVRTHGGRLYTNFLSNSDDMTLVQCASDLHMVLLGHHVSVY